MCQRSLPSYRDILCVYVHMCMLVHGEAVHLAYQVFVDTFHRHIHGFMAGFNSYRLRVNKLELATTSSSTHFHRQVHG